MSQALYAASTAAYSPVEAATWQAAQVSTVSVSNCLGRIFIGVLSDFCKHRLDLARPNMLIVVSCLVLLSQIIASVVEDVQSLWMASVALGLAYGSTFGLLPALAIDYFGIGELPQLLVSVADPGFQFIFRRIGDIYPYHR